MNVFKKTSALILLVFSFVFARPQSGLEEAWALFMENKIDDARTEFTKLSEEPSSQHEALLALSIINEIDQESKASFEPFKKFILEEKNINEYLRLFWNSDQLFGTKLTKEHFAFLNSLIESGKLNATNIASANLELADYYRKIMKFEDELEYCDKIDNITAWSLAGPFENISGSGFDKKFDPITKPEKDAEFLNKSGAPISWFEMLNYPVGKWMVPGYHSATANSIHYAQTFISSSKNQEVYLKIGISGSLKVWVNDKLAYSEIEERDLGIDAITIKVELNQGFNRILLQLGESVDVEDINFLVRVLNSKGQLLNLPASATFKTYPTDYNGTIESLPNEMEQFFIDLDKKENTILSKILLAKAYLTVDKTYEARKVINEALKIAPKSSYLSSMLMIIYSREESNTLLSLELEKVKKNDPNNPTSLEMQYNEAIDKEDYKLAGEITDKLANIFGENENVCGKRLDLLFKEDKTDEAIKYINTCYAKFPNSSTFVYYKYLVIKEVDKNVYLAIKILKKYNKKNYDPEVDEMIAGLYFSLGSSAPGIQIFEKLAAMYPYKPGYYNTLAEVNFSMTNYKQSIIYYNKLIENVPYIGYYFGKLAQAHKEAGNDEEANELYLKSIKYNPTDYEVRKDYRNFSGAKDYFSYFQEPDLYELYKGAKGVTDYPEDNSLIVLNETQRIIYQGGGAEEKHYLLIKILNSSGIDVWKDYDIPYNGNQNLEVIKAEVLKADGNKLKAEINGGFVVFTNLEQGDAILLIYKLQDYNSGKLLQHFWDYEYFNYFFPYSHQKYSLLVEGDQKFEHKVVNSTMKPEIKDVDDNLKVYIWERKDQNSLKDETYMQSICDFGEVMYYSSIPDWDFIRGWYYDISTTKAKADYEVKDVLQSILAGKEKLSDYEKVHLIYDYVVKNIRYSSISFRQSGIVPQKASKTINTRIGDCKDVATLFVALCREAGFKAEIMLVNTRDNGENDLALPSINFNHAISKVWIDGKEYVVELTSDYLPFSTMGRTLRKSFVLPINETSGAQPSYLDTKTRQPNKVSRKTKISISNTDKMNVHRKIVYYGDYSASIRSNFRDIGEEKRRKQITTNLSDEFAKTVLKDMLFDSTLYNTTDSVNMELKFDVEDPFIGFENKYLLKIPFADKQEPISFLNDDRNYPVAFWTYINDDNQYEEIIISMPSNMKISSLPKNVVLNSKFADYSLTFTQVGQDVLIKRYIVYKQDVIPVSEFNAFSDFFKKVIKADETQLGFQVK